MTLYMLDTNIVSHVIKGDLPLVRERLTAVPIQAVTISAVTEAELRYGVAKRGSPFDLARKVHEFLVRVDTLPWNSRVAAVYGSLRAACERSGITLAPLDMMIAAHAHAADAVLVTRDRAFAHVPDGPVLADWSKPG